MTNFECATDMLRRHREARAWSDDTVARDMLHALRLDPGGEVGAGAEAMALVDAARAGVVAHGEDLGA